MSEDDPKKGDQKEAAATVWDEDEEMRQWRREYEDLKDQLTNLKPDEDVLGELENLRRVAPPPGLEDRRAEPRYSFDGRREAKIYAHIGPKAFQIVNISVGGVAFYSDVMFEPGTNILLSALGMVALDVDVITCSLEETNPDFLEYQYLVRASFSPRVNGYLVYVLSREMYLRQLQGT